MKKKSMVKKGFIGIVSFCIIVCLGIVVHAWDSKPVKDDPLVRMPGTQPADGVNLEGPGRCLNCHGKGYDTAVEPGFNWKGSMMAQASRDPIFWACMTVAGQDSVYALGNPNAIDICERCHFPEGWLEGRSDPPNASAMTGTDYDGLHCDFCHRMYDPFAQDTHDGTREGSDWAGYWDEALGGISQAEADTTLLEDIAQIQGIQLFDVSPYTGGNFFGADNRPKYSTYTENASGQFFISTDSAKRASFADAAARHQMLYSRYHKSKYFCATCHDVSNPALANLDLSGLTDQSPDGEKNLITEQYSASQYFHVERTFSEFMLSAYGQDGGAATNADFQQQGAPEITWVAKCQDCHMRDVTGKATGGNSWISQILASLDPTGPVYDQTNVDLLDQGPSVLTLDLNAGETPKENGAALKAGSDRAKQQLLLAATIKDTSGVRDTVDYDPSTGAISFRIQNNTAHKLISGFPEGRRMFVNIQAYSVGNLIYEVNPYDYTVGTLKGLDPAYSPDSPALGPNEVYEDRLVYEVHPSSSLTGEEQTFHFVLATDRAKDIRIPPRGFDAANAAGRHCEAVWHGAKDTGSSPDDYFTPAEYAGGYDEETLTIAAGADYVLVTLYYQGTSREYIAFLRDEINGSYPPGEGTLPDSAYIIQTDPFFAQLKAWGNVIWDLWFHNHGLDGK
jgi:cytochrome c553